MWRARHDYKPINRKIEIERRVEPFPVRSLKSRRVLPCCTRTYVCVNKYTCTACIHALHCCVFCNIGCICQRPVDIITSIIICARPYPTNRCQHGAFNESKYTNKRVPRCIPSHPITRLVYLHMLVEGGAEERQPYNILPSPPRSCHRVTPRPPPL